MKKILIISGVFLFFIIAVILNLKSGKKGKEVEIEVVKRRSISESVKVEGYLEAYKQVEIGSEVIGKIKEIYVKKGDFVKKDELLCVIDPAEYQVQRDRIRIMLEKDLYELNLIKKNFEREKILFEKNLISQKEFENAEAQYKSLLFKVKEDSFSLKEADKRLSKCFIRSPMDGEVMEVYKKEGETVIAGTINNPASRIMVIADRSKMIVKCEVDETEIPKIEKGQKVKIKIDAFPDSIFEGVVMRIGGITTTSSTSQSAQTTPTFPVEVEIKSKNNLFLPGMSASCEIIVAEKDNAISLSYSAVGREMSKGGEFSKEEKDKTFVFLYKNNKAKKRYVKTGIKGLVRIEIEEGIEEGDTVIVGPQDILKELKDEELVKIKKSKEKKRKKMEK